MKEINTKRTNKIWLIIMSVFILLAWIGGGVLRFSETRWKDNLLISDLFNKHADLLDWAGYCISTICFPLIYLVFDNYRMKKRITYLENQIKENEK